MEEKRKIKEVQTSVGINQLSFFQQWRGCANLHTVKIYLKIFFKQIYTFNYAIKR